uniref:YidB family protein n=1 Tax=Catenulispora rubra TaxID=280293 RepID=UPI001E4F24EB
GLLSSGMLQKLAPMIGGLVAGGGLSKLMEQLKGGGLGSQAKSWVSSEQPNQPVSGEQITQALGHEQISQVANTLGMSHEEAAQTMAATLPQVVDAMTPEGRLPEAATAGAAATAGGMSGAANPAAPQAPQQSAQQPGSQGQNRPPAGGTSEGRPQGS